MTDWWEDVADDDPALSWAERSSSAKRFAIMIDGCRFLTEREKKVLTMRYLMDQKWPVIARDLGVSKKTAMRDNEAALKKLGLVRGTELLRIRDE